jgi:hypothetical protein
MAECRTCKVKIAFWSEETRCKDCRQKHAKELTEKSNMSAEAKEHQKASMIEETAQVNAILLTTETAPNLNITKSETNPTSAQRPKQAPLSRSDLVRGPIVSDAAPCTFLHEGRKQDFRCNLHRGPVSGVKSPTGIPTPSLLTVLNCHWCRTSLRSDTSPC